MQLFASIIALRGGVYTLLSLVMLAWWAVTGFGSRFAGIPIPFWSLIPASIAFAASIFLHRHLMRGRTTGFLPAMLATEAMLWIAVIMLGIRSAFLFWALGQIGGIILSVLVVAPMELWINRADPEVRELCFALYGRMAGQLAVLGCLFAVLLGAPSAFAK